jgi:hypothetical protein
VVGAMVMGLGGALMAHFFKFIAPTPPTAMATFLVWVMLIVGGSTQQRRDPSAASRSGACGRDDLVTANSARRSAPPTARVPDRPRCS